MRMNKKIIWIICSFIYICILYFLFFEGIWIFKLRVELKFGLIEISTEFVLFTISLLLQNKVLIKWILLVLWLNSFWFVFDNKFDKIFSLYFYVKSILFILLSSDFILLKESGLSWI